MEILEGEKSTNGSYDFHFKISPIINPINRMI